MPLLDSPARTPSASFAFFFSSLATEAKLHAAAAGPPRSRRRTSCTRVHHRCSPASPAAAVCAGFLCLPPSVPASPSLCRTPLLLLRAASSPRSYSAEQPVARSLSLQSTLWPLGHSGTLLVPEIDQWTAKPGNRLRPVELQRVVKELRKRHRHCQTLEVSEWMNAKGHINFLTKDHAVHLDLIDEVHGIRAAKTYFTKLPKKDKTEKPYGALLYRNTRELLIDKSLARFQKMKELGVVFSTLPYNNLMGLYTNLGKHEKVPSVMAEMKSNGVIPDNFSYIICINSYGTTGNLVSRIGRELSYP